jgi:hypothetical protein
MSKRWKREPPRGAAPRGAPLAFRHWKAPSYTLVLVLRRDEAEERLSSPRAPELPPRPIPPPLKRPASIPPAALLNPEIVLDMRDAGNGFGKVLGVAFLEAAAHRARRRDLAVRDGDLDLGRVDMRIIGQSVVHVLADALVRTLVALRPASAMLAALVLAPPPRRIVVAEPRSDLVAGALEEAALVALALTPPAIGRAALIATFVACAETVPEGDIGEAGLAPARAAAEIAA